jgi:hypothetical protein
MVDDACIGVGARLHTAKLGAEVLKGDNAGQCLSPLRLKKTASARRPVRRPPGGSRGRVLGGEKVAKGPDARQPQSKLVLDVGCGHGFFRYFSRLKVESRVVR